MSLYCLFYPRLLYIPLRDCRVAMLEKPLNKSNVIAVLLVYLCSVPFVKAMC